MTREPRIPATVARLRARMDRLNARLAAVLQARARLALAIGRAKAGLGLPAPDPAREREMLRRVLAAAPDGFPRRELARVLRAVFETSRRLVVADRRASGRARGVSAAGSRAPSRRTRGRATRRR